jgi:type IV pilus assembly protein PilQ
MHVWWRGFALISCTAFGAAAALLLLANGNLSGMATQWASWLQGQPRGLASEQFSSETAGTLPSTASANNASDRLSPPASDVPVAFQESQPGVAALEHTPAKMASSRPALADAVRQQLAAWIVQQDSQVGPTNSEAPAGRAADAQPPPPKAEPASPGPLENPQNQAAEGARPDVQPGNASLPPPPTVASTPGDRLTIRARQADIRELLEMLSRETGLSIIASPKTTGTVSATLYEVDPQTALDTLVRHLGLSWWQEGRIIFVGDRQEIQQIRQSREPMVTRVYRPNYVTAAELEKLVTPLLTQGVGQTTVTVGRVATSSPAKTGIATSSDTSGGNDFADHDVLMVRDYASVVSIIDELVNEVDRRPRQVALEAMILSVRLNDENQRGVDLELLRDENNARLISGTPLTDLAAINLSDGGLKFAFLDSSISAFIKALETVGDTDVIAAPRLMCLNKQRAEILIGSQLGYVSTTVTQTAATQTVQFLEVGTQLRFRPFIASDDMIRLEVHPELSTGAVRIEQGLTIPDKDVTQVTTNIMCRDGRTVIIGGLIREDLATNVTQIPVLGDIPFAGVLFRKKTEKVERREIIVLITPRIVHETTEEYEGARARDAFLARQENYFDNMSPAAKRQFGLRYLRLARAAWNAGDADMALRYVNLSLHFDPQNLEATTLRHQIVATLPPSYDTIHKHLNYGLAPWEIPTRDYSRHGAPWQATPPLEFPSIEEEAIQTPQPTPPRNLGPPIQP